MPQVTQAIRAFLTARKATHNGPDLIDRYLQYHPFMETQVNVAAGKGFPVDKKRGTFTDGIDEWFNLRIPKNANSEPSFRDYEIPYPFDIHADAIGSTGWDWSNRASRWVGFDFDSITGHAAGVGVSGEELNRVKEAASALPWVEVRRSTGGKGLHLYVMLDAIKTENHTIHAALGRAILGMMASETGFDFASQIDACGGNMWLWARKMSPENGGLALLKAATQTLKTDDLPINWRDHVEVVTRQRAKVRVGVVTDEHQDPFEVLASSRQVIPLDDKHKEIIDELKRSGFTTVWVPDYHLLQTHTCALSKLMDEKKEEFQLTGFFKTSSQGKDPGTSNCFLFPVDKGGFRVYRFSPGISEAPTWEQDGAGWTTCYFNRNPTLRVASRALGGVEDPEKGGFVFDEASAALEAAKALGQKIDLPNDMLKREARLRAHKDGRLAMQIVKGDDDEGMKGRGWLAKKGYWSQIFATKVEQKTVEFSSAEFDNVLRAMVTPNGDDAGWYHRFDVTSPWHRHPTEKIKLKLTSQQRSDQEVRSILGSAVEKAWTLVNLPFQDEYPGNRQWNHDAAQFRFKPAELKDDAQPYHPHWDMILKHCGQDLDEALKGLEWARNANIRTGADYLLHWAACMLREPYEKLPYLFFWGDQNSGKSIYHESLAELMTKGVAAADRALTNANDFNGELANAVLAVIEEKDLSLSAGAYNKLKDWVTSPKLWVRKMRTDAYSQVNTLHFVQIANGREACTIKSGDTRITMFFVPMLLPGQEIPKPILMDRLRDEAPHFMRTIMDLQLPPMYGRLRLPVVSTENKARAEESSRDPLEAFLADKCFEIPGELVLFTDFFEKFQEWMVTEEIENRGQWGTRTKVARSLPPKFPYGVKHSNQRYVGNISWVSKTFDPTVPPFVLKDGKLKPRGN